MKSSSGFATRFATTFVLYLTCWSATSTAQTSADSSHDLAGKRVRISFVKSDDDGRLFGGRVSTTLKGRVASVASDTFYVIPHWTPIAIAVPRSSIRWMGVSRGRSRVRSALINAFPGAAIGFSMDQAIHMPWPGTENPLTLRYTAAGAAFGMITGAIWPEESWRRHKLR